MRVVGTLVFAILSNWLFSQSAIAEKRVALTIGNSTYQHVGHLTNPANDAALMMATFKRADFDVVDSRVDLSVTEMRRVLRDFADKARDADIAVIYYAGHGIEVDGVNYLVPVDAVLERDTDVYDEAFALDRVLVAIEPARQLRLIILDACRDNPFARTMRRTIGLRAIGRGLAKVEPSNPNTMIAFAAKAGFTAFDGDGKKTSPFAAALAEHLTRPGLDLRKAFGFVRDDVLKATYNKQEPFIYGSLGGNDVALVPAKPVVSTPTPNPNIEIRRDYELALQIGTKDVWTAFLAQYPDGLYSTLAKGQLSKIASEEARVAATEKARLAEEEKARLRAEGAKQAEQAKAAAQAKAAEDARIAAEKAKQAEQEKVAAAEQARAAAEKAAADRLAAQMTAAEKLFAERAQAAKTAIGQIAAKKAVSDNAAPDKIIFQGQEQDEKPGQQVVSLPPSEASGAGPALSPAEIARSVQIELRRVGCLTGTADGEWTSSSGRALELFNKRAGTKLDTKLASLDALDAIKAKPARVCPVVCEHGYKTDGDSCIKNTCGAGSFINNDNECQKSRKRPTKLEVKHDQKPDGTPLSGVARADQANRNGTYQNCMGPQTGCYGRAIVHGEEHARQWCSRRPTC
jgi:Caspase domain